MDRCLTFVTPAYRTESSLPTLIDEIEQAAELLGVRHEVVVVDDACPNDSGQTVMGRPGVRVERLALNQGQRAALLHGLSLVHTEFVCVLDADLQDDPRSVVDLMTTLEASDFDVVCAGRRGRHQSTVRRCQAWIFRRLRWISTGGRVPADAGFFHVTRTSTARRMVDAAAPSDDLLMAYIDTGARITSVPIERRMRPVGRSSYTTAQRWSLAFASLRRTSTNRNLPPRHVREQESP